MVTEDGFSFFIGIGILIDLVAIDFNIRLISCNI